jgi:hypothetical protein
MIPIMVPFVPAAAARRRRRMREEEKMTNYGPEDLDGWEFKIVRAITPKFKNQDMIEKVRMEEARAGWELLEKFDDYRLRFKRRVEKRAMDKHLEIDPYRSQLATPKRLVVAIIVGILIMLIGILVLIGNKTGFDRSVVEGLTVPGVIFVLLAIFGLALIIAVLRRRI